jgi:hypothetical protein
MDTAIRSGTVDMKQAYGAGPKDRRDQPAWTPGGEGRQFAGELRNPTANLATSSRARVAGVRDYFNVAGLIAEVVWFC